MSGERVEAIKDRAGAFLELAKELAMRARLDLALFNIQQACQLRVKSTLLRVLGEVPRIHSIRELLGILAKGLEDIDHASEADNITQFVRKWREVLVDIEASYTESRYGVVMPTKKSIGEMMDVADKLFKLLDGVENSVLG